MRPTMIAIAVLVGWATPAAAQSELDVPSLHRSVLTQVIRAHELRDEGRLEEALDAYEEIRRINPTLTVIGLVVGDVYRQQADAAPDAGTRRALLERAREEYASLVGHPIAGAQAAAGLDAIGGDAAPSPE